MLRTKNNLARVASISPAVMPGTACHHIFILLLTLQLLNVHLKMNILDKRSFTDTEHFTSAPGQLCTAVLYKIRLYYCTINIPLCHTLHSKAWKCPIQDEDTFLKHLYREALSNAIKAWVTVPRFAVSDTEVTKAITLVTDLSNAQLINKFCHDD